MKKKFFSLVAALLISVLCLTGCGVFGGDNDPTVLRIQIFQGGYGTDWLNDMIELYKKKYPDQKVKREIDYTQSAAITNLKSGSSKYDLFFARGDMFQYVITPTTLFGVTYETLIEDLTDIYEAKIPGEEVTLKEKMDKMFVDYNAVEGKDGNTHYYTVPWAIGQNGLIRNNDLWDKSWGTPRTTDELIALLDKIKATGKYPLIFSLSNQYWDTFYHVWFYQYEGYQGYTNFWNGIDSLGRAYQPELLLYDGKLESLKVLQQILNPDNKYCHPYCTSVNFTSAQNYFLEGSLGSPLTLNADWMNGELRVNYNVDEANIEMIKAPIISALGTKLGISDAVLAEIVDYVDGVTETEPSFTSSKGLKNEEVIAAVREARGMNISSSTMHSAWIPTYAKNKDAAKKFLQLMASDEGIETFVKGSYGHILPYDYDYSSLSQYMSPFLKGTNQFIIDSLADPDDDERVIASYIAKDRLFALGGLSINGNNLSGSIVTMLAASNPNDRSTAEEIFLKDYEGVKARWSSYLTLAGLD